MPVSLFPGAAPENASVSPMIRRTKPEHMTHLSGSRLVCKSHGRIAFRGMIDSLEAEILEAQALAGNMGAQWYRASLGEVLAVLREILAAEVRETALPPFTLFGLSPDDIHRQSHDTEGAFGIPHPLPSAEMGALAVRLNTLRAHIREGELLAVRFLRRRKDIVTAMNRLSSALYWLFLNRVSGKNV
jgi:ethanolamine utilization cobalamin adenosyltransferase